MKSVLVKLQIDLVKRAKILAAERGVTLREIINQALAQYLNREVKK